MKIRILDDTIRLRLDRTEVDRIGAAEPVRCSTHFPGGAVLHYGLRVDGDEPGATFADGDLQLSVPMMTAQQWADNDTEVSIQAALPLDSGVLNILIEKDFECLEPRQGESQANRFVNPKKR